MNKLNSKNWQRIRINHTNKTITFTNDTTYKTMTECQADIKSTQYIAINLKRLNDLLSDGYSINDANIKTAQENVSESIKQAENLKNEEVVVDADIEAQIEAYTKAKIERDILAYAEKKRKQDAVKNFLNVPKQEKQKPFDYSFYNLPKSQQNKILRNRRNQINESVDINR